MTLMQKIEMLGSLLTRTGLNPIEIDWVNGVMAQLRAMATEAAKRAEAKEAAEKAEAPASGHGSEASEAGPGQAPLQVGQDDDAAA